MVEHVGMNRNVPIPHKQVETTLHPLDWNSRTARRSLGCDKDVAIGHLEGVRCTRDGADCLADEAF